jgi:hypothetical protein
MTSVWLTKNQANRFQSINFDSGMFRLTVDATCSSFFSNTGKNGPASGQCPLDSAPTADPRMIE